MDEGASAANEALRALRKKYPELRGADGIPTNHVVMRIIPDAIVSWCPGVESVRVLY